MADDNNNENLLQQLLEAFKNEGLAFPQKLIDLIRGSKPEEVNEKVESFLSENKESLGPNASSLVSAKLEENKGNSAEALANNPTTRDTDKLDMDKAVETAKNMLGTNDGTTLALAHTDVEKIGTLETEKGPENHIPENGMDAGMGVQAHEPGAMVVPTVDAADAQVTGPGAGDSPVDDFHTGPDGRMVGPGAINDDPATPGSFIGTGPGVTDPQGVGIPSSGDQDGGMMYADVMMEDGKTLGPDNINLQQAGGPGPDVVPAPDPALLNAVRNATSSAPVSLPAPAPAPTQVIPANANEAFAAMMYKDYLGRDISQEEMTARGAQLDSGYDKNQMAQDIGLSPEAQAFQDRTLASGNEFEGIVTQMFRDYVGQDPDPLSVRIHSAALKNGAHLEDLEAELMTSPIVQAHVASDPVTDAERINQNTLMAQAVQAANAAGTYHDNGYKLPAAVQIDPRQQELSNVVAALSNTSISDDDRTKILQNAQATMGLSPAEETVIDQTWFNHLSPAGQSNWNAFVAGQNGTPMTVQPVRLGTPTKKIPKGDTGDVGSPPPTDDWSGDPGIGGIIPDTPVVTKPLGPVAGTPTSPLRPISSTPFGKAPAPPANYYDGIPAPEMPAAAPPVPGIKGPFEYVKTQIPS